MELITLEGTATASATGTHCKGEKYECGVTPRSANEINCVKCATAKVSVPSGARVQKVNVLVKEGNQSWNKAVLGENAKSAIGWCEIEASGSNGNNFYARLKNWKHDRTRNVKISVTYEAP